MRLRLLLIVAALSAWPAQAAQDDKRLDQLFAALLQAKSAEIAKPIEEEIFRVWTETPSATTELLYERSEKVADAGNTELALKLLDSVVKLDPHYAQGWNMRATVHVMREEYTAAVADIEQVLLLEPRHFGALAGLGRILEETGDDKGALAAYEAALKIDPALEDIKQAADKVRLKVFGRPI